jgi:hypothetical protein
MDYRALRNFYNNESERKAVQDFQFEVLRELAADLALRGEDTAGIATAKKFIDKSFNKLSELYDKIEEVEVPNTR